MGGYTWRVARGALYLYLVLMFSAAVLRLWQGSSPWYLTAVAFWGLMAFNLVHGAVVWGWRRSLGLAAWALVVTWAFEALGVSTGWPFGRYRYQATFLGPHIGPVPLLVPFAWYSVAYAAWHVMARGTSWQVPALRALAASWALTAWDLMADPLLVARGMWVWETPGAYFGIPLGNYVGWLLTGWVLFYGWERLGRPTAGQDALPWVAYTGIAVIYVLLCLAEGLAGPALAGGMAMGGLALWSGTRPAAASHG